MGYEFSMDLGMKNPNFKINFFYSDQAEARRKRVKDARIRREERIAQKKEEMLKNIEEAKK